jgi:putative glutamine amidotransferase
MNDIIVLNSNGGMTFGAGVSDVDLPRDLERASELMILNRNNAILLLEGGADIDTGLYGQERKHAHHPSGLRDAREVFFYTMARRLRIPVLGICRGHQLMAVLEGGTLYQDIYLDAGVEHGGSHLVHFQADGSFAALMESNPPQRYVTWGRNGAESPIEPGRAWVNSMHHQAVELVPSSGVVAARTREGLIEAIIYPFGLGVQWHPEVMGHTEMVQWVWDHVRGQ